MHELDINLPGWFLSSVCMNVNVGVSECGCVVHCMLRIRDVATERELDKTSKPSCLALEFLLYIYVYIEIAIAVTDGFAATQATAEHATNVVVVANKTKSKGS